MIGAIDPVEKTILVNWYNSLTSKGNLNWNVGADLCYQTGVTCTSTRVTKL